MFPKNVFTEKKITLHFGISCVFPWLFNVVLSILKTKNFNLSENVTSYTCSFYINQRRDLKKASVQTKRYTEPLNNVFLWSSLYCHSIIQTTNPPPILMGGLNIFRNDKKRRIFFLSINRGTLKKGVWQNLSSNITAKGY